MTSDSLKIGQPTKLTLICVGLIYSATILAVQRYFVVHLYACLVPFILSLICFRINESLRNTFLIIAVFLCIDNGGEGSSVTNSLIRYLIYLTTVYAFLEGAVFSKTKIAIYCLVLVIPIGLTLLNLFSIDLRTFIRDIQVVFLMGIIICRSRSSTVIPMNVTLLCNVILIFVAAEIVNIATQNVLGGNDYLNYSSSKSLIVIPALYFLSQNKLLKFILAFVAITVVLVPYGTRMIMLTYMLMIVVGIVHARWLKLSSILALCLLIAFVSSVLELYDVELAGFKATGVFIQLLGDEGLLEKIKLIDPIRYTETYLFFKRDLLHVFFGNGFGAGLHDDNNEMFFVQEYNTAFSSEELNTRTFYNLHDTWIDLGLRFGLIFIVLAYANILRNVFSKNRRKTFYAMSLFVLFSSATYSFQGLLLITLFWLFLNQFNSSNQHVQKLQAPGCAVRINNSLT